MEDPETREAASAIGELQSVFDTILLASRKVDPVNDYHKGWYRAKIPKLVKPATKPKWTGAFKIMDFPREIRDEIYFHYLYRLKGVFYRRNTSRTFPFDDHPEGTTSLLLTCRQVYNEAFPIFSRYNLVEIRSSLDWRHQSYRLKSMDGVLRLFPDAPARSLQRVALSIEMYSYIYHQWWGRGDPDRTTPPPGEAFVQMLRDAYTFKATFPKLREFSVIFHYIHNFFGESNGFVIGGDDEEEKIGKCVQMMEMWLGESDVVPPAWFRFYFDDDWAYQKLKTQEGTWNRAYVRLVKERAQRVMEVEDDGKMVD